MTDATISISDGKGGMTPPVQLELFQQALNEVKKAAPMKANPDFKAHNDQAYAVTADELRQFVERFEQLAKEKADIAEQQQVMAEAKGRGYDTKIIRKIIALRKRKPDDIAEEEAILEIYKAALGMV